MVELIPRAASKSDHLLKDHEKDEQYHDEHCGWGRLSSTVQKTARKDIDRGWIIRVIYVSHDSAHIQIGVSLTTSLG